MVVRRKKRSVKMRGSKTYGWGSKKKHRGGGSRGGRGAAGLMKHKKSLWIKNNPRLARESLHKRVGRKFGFKMPQDIMTEIRAINLKNIDILAKNLNKTVIDLNELGYEKVLSTGRITQPLTIKAKKFSPNAKSKIEEAGGKAIEE